MTIYNKTSLKTFFETGDVPNGQNYADFIDSCLNLAETAVQSVAGPINPTELITAQVSAGSGVFTGTLRIDGSVSAATAMINSIDASAMNATRVSAGSINSVGNVTASAASVYASAMRSSSGYFSSIGVVSAAGTSQGTAATITFPVNRGAGVVDGTTTGFLLQRNLTGYEQYIINGGASANLWPGDGGVINALATNAAFGMTANTLYQIIHIGASAYAVK